MNKCYYQLTPNPVVLVERGVRLPSSYRSASGRDMMHGELLLAGADSHGIEVFADYSAETSLPDLFIDSFCLLLSSPPVFEEIYRIVSSRQPISYTKVRSQNCSDLRIINLPVVDCINKEQSRILYNGKRIRMVTILALSNAALVGYDMVRVKGWEVAIVVSETIMDAVIRGKHDGVIARPLRSD